MSSKIGPAVAVGLVMLAAQMPLQWRVRGLEAQLANVQREARDEPRVWAQLHARDQTAEDALRAALRAGGRSRPRVVASFDAVERRPPGREPAITLARSPEPAVASAWREVSDGELDTIVAGAGMAPPGPLLASVSSGEPAAGGLRGPSVEEPDAAPKRLAPRVEKGGLLLRKGRTQIEPTVAYSHLSKNRVGLSGFSVFDVIFVGEIRAEEVDRDLLTNSLTIRHGLTNSLQAEVTLPGQLQREEVLSGPIEQRQQSVSRHAGFSDVSAGLFYQFGRETATRPGLIGNVRIVAPTGSSPRFGSGVWGVKTGVTAIKTSDPVVLFTNLAHSINFPGQVNGLDVNPGNSSEYSAGIAYALNYNVAINAGFEQVFVGPSEALGATVPGSRLVVSNLKTGFTVAFSKRMSTDLSVEAGLTEDSPDLTVAISCPITF